MQPAGDELASLRASLAPRLPGTVVALDFDGTLAPIVERPEDARALPGVADVLTRLASRVARVAIVTGRPALEAVELGGFADVPGLVVCGHYGLERWSAGRLESPQHTRGVDEARRRVSALVDPAAGLTLEDKGHSVAVHTRRANDPVGALELLRGPVTEIAVDAGLQVTPGRFVLELRPRDVDKGATVRELVAEVSATAVVYAGDDVGDVPAVDAVRALEVDGVLGLVICSDAAEVAAELRDRADLVVPGPPGVLGALRALLLS